MLDSGTTVNRIAKAIDRVFSCSGWIKGQVVYLPEELTKIGESMARRAAEPSKFVCQGYHTTSVIQSKMLQLLETNPVSVIEPISDLVTTGKAIIGGKGKEIEVEIDPANLALDLEARLCDEKSICEYGFRDASGQIYDLLIMQAYLDSRQDSDSFFSFRQKPSENCQTTGESIVKTFKNIPGRQDVVSEGTSLTIEDAFNISELLEGRIDGLCFHSSVYACQRALPVLSSDNLVERVKYYQKLTARPSQIAVFINKLLSPNLLVTGHDLHLITAIYDENSEQFYCQSLWGQTYDSALNGVDKDILFNSMKFNSRQSKDIEDYDNTPSGSRFIDTVFPVKPRDWCMPLLEARKECTKLEQAEIRAFSTPGGKALKKFNEDLRSWEELRAQHVKVFGDSMPFDIPKPKRP